MIQIRFIAQGSNSLIGGFSSGDLARVGESLAHHLVEEARVAEYVVRRAPIPVEPLEEPKPARRSRSQK